MYGQGPINQPNYQSTTVQTRKDGNAENGGDYWNSVSSFSAIAVVADGPLPIGDALADASIMVYSAYTSAKVVADYINMSGVHYTLRAINSGEYPVYTFGFKYPTDKQYLEAGEIWKIGQTTQYDFVAGEQYRYSECQVKEWGVKFLLNIRVQDNRSCMLKK